MFCLHNFLPSPSSTLFLAQLFFFSFKLYFGMVKKSLSSVSWKPKHSFQLKVIQTIRISVEHSSSWLPSAKDPFSYLTKFLWNTAGIILIPPRSLSDHCHQISDCSFTQRTAWSCFIALHLIAFLPQMCSFFFLYVSSFHCFSLHFRSPWGSLSLSACLPVSLPHKP